MTEKSIVFGGSQVFYKVEGTGKTVLLIHGFAETGTVWNEQLEFLSPHCRLIIPDLPGSGLSPLIPDANIETYADILCQLLEQELPPGADGSREKACIVGHSMGGYITLSIAEKNPDLVASFCLFHSSAFADDESKKETRLKAIRVISEKGVSPFIKTTIPGMFSKEYATKHPEKVSELVSIGIAFSPASLVQYYEAMIHRPDRTHVLKSFAGPVLFIMGKHDAAIPLEISLAQCHLPAVSHVLLLEDSGHMGMLEETNKANEQLLKFIC